ncbi:MAG: hypothetical protein ACK5JH_03380 [Anaerocolumna sp.]
MNKLEGFIALRESGLPSVPWKEYHKDTILEDEILWTVRSAVAKGEDFNLPRKVGVCAKEAKEFADDLLNRFKENDLVLYYPYFIALKSGVIDISRDRIVIEAVKDDLWNLVTYNKKNVTIIFEHDNLDFVGDADFLSSEELNNLIDYCIIIKNKFPNYLLTGKSVLLEWSFACKTSLNKTCVGKQSLVFYEIRTL